MDNARGQWKAYRGWYGTFVENVVQATARDLLAAALGRLEAAGFEIIAHVHDEIVAEVPEGADCREEFIAVMTQAPPWADGLPIAAKAWSGQRFIKSAAPTRATSELPAEDVSEPSEGPEFFEADEDERPRGGYPYGESPEGPTENVFIYRDAGGKRAVLSNVIVELQGNVADMPLAGRATMQITSAEEALDRLKRIRAVGFDDVLCMVRPEALDDLARLRDQL